MRSRAKTGASFISTFGLELKAANLIALDGREDHRRILQRFLSRPALEPILLHMWKDLTAPEIDPAAMARFASGVAGRPVEPATGRMRTTPTSTGEYTIYASPEERARLTAMLRDNTRQDHGSPVAASLVAYALTIICHPLADGNGRLARALLLGALGGRRLISAPIVPVGPAFYMHAGLIGPVMARLSESGDWASAVDELAPVLSTACDLADGIDRLT